eukprot:m.144394 g.144394  ORF g.144394 m.144394 type:complete len:203 (+) comp23026_c0_seq4:296-904(+)
MSVEPKLAVDDASLLPALALGMAGAVGGMASLVVTYPLYTVTMQQQAHVNDTAGDGPADLSPTAGQVAGARPATAVAVVRRILRDEGWVGLFKGLKSALVANGIQSAVYCASMSRIASPITPTTARTPRMTTHWVSPLGHAGLVHSLARHFRGSNVTPARALPHRQTTFTHTSSGCTEETRQDGCSRQCQRWPRRRPEWHRS